MNMQTLDILYEDSHILVCVKPAGIATQSRNIRNPDMVSILKNHIAKNTPPENPSSTGSRKEPYLAVIHRLDQPVQGIMVFAKTPFAAKELSRQLQTNGFGKYYRALVTGKPPKASDTLESYMKKDAKRNVSLLCQKQAAGAKLARLSYKIVPENQQYFAPHQNTSSAPADSSLTELDIRLHTGRHHQIRLQLASIGCPIIGDTKYNPEDAGKSGWQELKLCSYRLEFMNPRTKKPMSFSLI